MEEEKKINRKAGLAAGIIICVLALTGLVFLISLGVSAIKDAHSRKLMEQYAEYNEFLIPAAAIDIEPFDDISSANMSELVEMSIWSILNSDLNPDNYSYSNGNLVLPSSEVKTSFEHYFGTEIQIQHCTVEGYGYEFTYDETNDVYYIPLTTISPIYTPAVSAVDKKGSSITVTCGLKNASLWTQDKITGEMTAPEPDKYIKVTLRSSGKDMYISAIQSSSTPETASTEAVIATEAASTETSSEETTAEASADTATTAAAQ